MCNRAMRSMLKVVVLAVFSALFLTEAAFAASARWSMNLHIPVPAREVALRGASGAKAHMVDPVVAKMEAAGMAVRLKEQMSGIDDASYEVEAAASGSVEDLRRLVYQDLKEEVKLLGGVAGITITSSGAQSLASDVVIAANPSTGYQWMAADDSGYQERAAADFVMHTPGLGRAQHQVLHLRNAGNQNNPIKLVYRRPWEPAPAKLQIDLDLDSLPDKLDLSDPTVPAGPAAPPLKGTVSAEAFPTVATGTLPSSWDWRTSGIVTPVRDQGSCGGCWSFGTVGIMESTLWKNGTPNVDLSEQFLISCNTSNWNCDGGGLTAHMYHYDRLGRNQTAIGAVLEADKPFTATNGTCAVAYDHPYKLSGWQFIVPTEFDMPTVDQIKSAIYTYGPITAAVCVGNGFDNYTGGVFSTDETSQCNGGTNHQIILVGWDDNGGNGYWILRNSWGSSWGLGGYMNIKYNTSRVGEGTSWVTTAAVTPNLTLKAVPASLEVARGGSGSTTISTTVAGGFNSAVTLSATGLPSGVTASFSPASIAAPGSGSSTLTFSATTAAATGSYQVKVTGTGGSLSREVTLTLTVTSGSTTTLLSDGFEGASWVYFQPTGTTAVWSAVGIGTHPDLTPRGGSFMAKFNSYSAGSGDQALYHHTTPFAIPGSASSVTLKFWMYHDPGYVGVADSLRPYIATDGLNYSALAPAILRYDGSTGWAEARVDLTGYKGQSSVLIGFMGTSAYGNNIYLDDVSVVADLGTTPSFAASAAASTVSVGQGATGSTTLTTTVSGGFNSAVSLSATGLPSGVTASFSPASIPAPGSGSSTVTFSATGSALAGSYPVTVSCTGGGITQTLNLTVTVTPPPSFALSAAPTTVAVVQGGSGTSTISSTVTGGFNAQVALTVTGLPSGVTASFSPASIGAPGSGSSTLTLSAAASTAAGSYQVKVTGTGGSLSKDVTLTLTVSSGSSTTLFSDGFEGAAWTYFQATGTSAVWSTVNAGTFPSLTPRSGSYMAKFNSYSATSGDQALYHHTTGFAIPGSASSVTLKFWMYHDTGYSFDADSLRPCIATDGQNYTPLAPAILRYDGSTGWAEASVDLGSYKGQSSVLIGFLGTSAYGNNIYLDDVTVVADLSATPSFAASTSAGTVSVGQGATGSTTLTTTVSGGFNSAVSLSASGLPSGVTASFTPASIPAPGSGSSTLTFSATAGAAVGSYPVTITCTGGGVTKTVNLTVTVTSPPSFALSAAPATVSAAPGQSATSLLTTTVSNGFNSTVSLSASGLPAAVTASFNPASIAAPGSGSSTVTFSVAANAATGSYPVKIVASGGGVTKEFSITLVVGTTTSLFNDGFEGAGWTVASVTGTQAAWSLTASGTHPTVAPHGGSMLASFNSYDALSGSARLFRPAGFAIPSSGGTVTLSFWMYHDLGYTAADQVQVQVSTDGTAWSDVGTPVMRYDWTTGWSRAEVNLTGYKGQSNVRIGFLGTSLYGNNIFLDDVSVDVGPGGDFSVAATPGELSLPKGGRGTLTVSTTTSGGFSEAIDLSITGLPSGTVATFNPESIPAPGSGSASVALKVATTTAAGSYPVTITGTGGGVTKNTSFTLTVTDPSFALAASPGTVTVRQGGTGSVTLSTTISGGFNAAVTPTASGLPGGVTASFSPASIAAPGAGSLTVTFAASAGAAAGSYPVTIAGTGGGLTQQTTVTVTVQAVQPPYFRIPASTSYASFSSMYTTLTEGSSVVAYACDRTLAESLTLDRNVTLVLKGGYDSTFTSVTGRSAIDAAVVVRKGKLVVDRVVLK